MADVVETRSTADPDPQRDTDAVEQAIHKVASHRDFMTASLAVSSSDQRQTDASNE